MSIVHFHPLLIVLLTIHSHPDKVKLTGNDTAESAAALFVEITKAYKAYAIIEEVYLI